MKPTPTETPAEPYKSLWSGLKDEPGLPEALQPVFAMLDDARNAQMWLDEQALTVHRSDGRELDPPYLAELVHLTEIGWKSSEDGRKRFAVFDGVTVTEDESASIAKHAIATAIVHMTLSTDIEAFGVSLDEPRKYLWINLAGEMPGGLDDVTTPGTESGYAIQAEVICGQIQPGAMKNLDDEGPTAFVSVNARAQLCLDWLCRRALPILRDELRGLTGLVRDQDKPPTPTEAGAGEPETQTDAGNETPREAADAKPADAAPTAAPGTGDPEPDEGAPPAPRQPENAEKPRKEQDANSATRNAESRTEAGPAPGKVGAGDKRNAPAPARRPGSRADANGSRYRYH